jgi:disulfide bond formation protein DsbB
MSLSTRLLTNVFVVLALVANAFFLWVLLAGALAGLRFRRPFTATVTVLGEWTRPLAVAIATTCTFGSLYYSEAVGYVPCQLCWYQRYAMYPLVAILAVGLWRPARTPTRILGLAVAVVGAGIAGYHWLVERIPSLADATACSVRVPCSVPWFTKLGFMTIAWMALSGFLAVGALLAVEAVAARTRPTSSARMSQSQSDGPEVDAS